MTRIYSDCTRPQASKNSKQTSKIQLFLKPIFELFWMLNHSKGSIRNSLSKQKVQVTVECSIWCLQMASLLWMQSLNIKNWSNDLGLWKMIGYLRLDNACAALEIIDTCLYTSIFWIFSIFSITIALFFAISYAIKIPKTVIYLLEKFIYLWQTLICIPSIQLLSIFIKYNFSHKMEVNEYENITRSADFEIPAPWNACCILAIGMCFIIIILNSKFSGEIRHSWAKNIITAKAHSKIDFHAGILTFLLPVLGSIFDEDYIVYLQFFAMLSSFLLILESIMYLPYFCLYSNTIALIKFFILAWIAFIFILGEWLDNILIIKIFAIFLSPIIIILVIIYTIRLHKRINKGIPMSIIEMKNKYDLEKSLRYELCSLKAENKDQIIYIFETFFSENILWRDKLQVIWLANYCLFTLKDAGLAKIKICKCKTVSDWDLEANYQEYLCYREIMDSKSNESVAFECYHNKLNEIKNIDRVLCKNLSSFWKEIASKQPKFSKLIDSINSISRDIQFLSNEYKKLTTDFHTREGLDLYCSYLKNIIYDYENYDKVSYKVNSFEGYYSNTIKNMSYFDCNNGILIFSNEEENFGEVLFANPKVAESFNFPLKSIIGDNIFSFIPLYYKNSITENIKKMLNFGLDTEIDLGESFFLISPNSDLLKCMGKALLSSLNNYLATILVFKINDYEHQAALISDNKTILCYTKGFPQLVRKPSYNLTGFPLSRIFPDLENVDLQQHSPYFLSLHDEIILVFLTSNTFGIKIPYIIFISNYAEFSEWKIKNFKVNLDEENLIENSPKLYNALRPSNFNEISSNYQDETYEKNIDCENDIQLTIDKTRRYESKLAYTKDEDEPQKNKNIAPNAFIHMVKVSSRSINVVHLVFVLAILWMLITYILVLIYAYYSINAVRDANVPIILENLGESFIQMGLFSRLASIFKDFGDNIVWQFSYKYFAINIQNLEIFYSKAISLLSKNNLCSAQDFFIQKNINLWKVNNGIYREKASLLDTTSQFIQLGNDFMEKLNSSIDVSNEVVFFVLNGYDEAFHYCNQSMHEIVACQKSQILDYKSEILVLLIVGIFAFALCICFMTPFCYSAIKNENILWNKIRKHAYKYYDKLYQPCIERLSSIHSKLETTVNNELRFKNDQNFRNSWKYIWRLCLLLIVTSAFCIVSITVFYGMLIKYLYSRPELIENLLNSQILLTDLDVWTTEASLKITSYSIEGQTEYPNPFSNTYKKFIDSVSRINVQQKKIRDPKYSPIISDSFKQRFYEEYAKSERLEHRMGSYAAEEYSITEAEFISRFDAQYINDWINLVVELQDLDSIYDGLIDSINKYSLSVINQQMKIIIAALVIFIICCCVMYACLYLTFFIKEKRNLKRISSMLEIMPQ